MIPRLTFPASYKAVKAWCKEAKKSTCTEAENECVNVVKAAAREHKASGAELPSACVDQIRALLARLEGGGTGNRKKSTVVDERKAEKKKINSKENSAEKVKKRKRASGEGDVVSVAAAAPSMRTGRTSVSARATPLPPHRHVLAPMVGGSELAFRMLCRRYGADLCYSPMMYSGKFVEDAAYRQAVWHTHPADRPLVAHFCGNDPTTMVAAGRLVQDACDAVDINLGCPQRVAHSGHFGSYLMQNAKDRALVCDMVKAMAAGLKVPVFCKIRLLETVEATIAFVKQLRAAGASLVAVHGRYPTWLTSDSSRGSATNRRDGAAHLDQVAAIRAALPPDFPILSNGNVRCPEDISANLRLTGVDGIMVAEAILDDPSIFSSVALGGKSPPCKRPRTLSKAPHSTASIEKATGSGAAPLDKIALATEYLECAEKYPSTTLATVVFHVRRIARDAMNSYQLMDSLNRASTVEEVRSIVDRAAAYQYGQTRFEHDPRQQEREREAAERKKREEGKRKAYEQRMVRKAKRDGREDLQFYLRTGLAPPSRDDIKAVLALPEAERMPAWRQGFGQHCMAYHLGAPASGAGGAGQASGCTRERTCAFLHVDALASAAGEAGGSATLDGDPTWLSENQS